MEQSWLPLKPHFGALRADQITKDDVRSYTQRRRGLGVSNGGIRTELAYLNAALVFHLGEKSAPKIHLPPQGRPRERYLLRNETRDLIANAIEFHIKMWIILALATAGRPSHVLQLTWDRVDMKRREINLDDPGRDETQKGRARVPINDTAFEHLSIARQLARSKYVIELNGKPIASVRKGIASAARRAGLKGVSPYVIRHTAGVYMAEDGVPLDKIAAYMGHTSLETTRKHYARFQPGHLQQAARSLDMRPDDHAIDESKDE